MPRSRCRDRRDARLILIRRLVDDTLPRSATSRNYDCLPGSSTWFGNQPSVRRAVPGIFDLCPTLDLSVNTDHIGAPALSSWRRLSCPMAASISLRSVDRRMSGRAVSRRNAGAFGRRLFGWAFFVEWSRPCRRWSVAGGACGGGRRFISGASRAKAARNCGDAIRATENSVRIASLIAEFQHATSCFLRE